jgi:hypothetical protein
MSERPGRGRPKRLADWLNRLRYLDRPPGPATLRWLFLLGACLLLEELARQVGTELGQADGVIVFDSSGFAKKGTASIEGKRQALRRLGKADNGQVGIFMSYVSGREHALADVRLYLPQEWAKREETSRAVWHSQGGN